MKISLSHPSRKRLFEEEVKSIRAAWTDIEEVAQLLAFIPAKALKPYSCV